MRLVNRQTGQQRRKMLRVSLRQLFGGRGIAEGLFPPAMLTMRPEQLSVAQFVELTNLVEAAMKVAGDAR